MGRAFSFLFAHRTCSTHPEGRRRREGEAQVAEILTNEISGYQDFEAFLNAQGFTMRANEQGAIGVAARGQVFVMARRCTDEQAPYIDSGWVFERMRDRRSTEPLDHVVVWAAQLWATMQWFFYTRLDRGIDAVGRFKEAFVNVSQLARWLSWWALSLSGSTPIRSSIDASGSVSSLARASSHLARVRLASSPSPVCLVVSRCGSSSRCNWIGSRGRPYSKARLTPTI
jgi:hypothetical protein